MIRFEQTDKEYPGMQHTLIEIPDDSDISKFIAAVRAFALAMGYHPETVTDALGEAG